MCMGHLVVGSFHGGPTLQISNRLRQVDEMK
jgi:hypothetical protein